MPGDNNIRIFTAADIERYHKGLLSPRERHAMEKAALEDPFLADALEGYAEAPASVAEDLAALRQRLADRTEEKKVVPMIAPRRNTFSWWKVAAMLVLVGGAGLLVYQFGFQKSSTEIAQAPQQKNAPAESRPDTNTSVVIGNTAPANENENTRKEDDSLGSTGLATRERKTIRVDEIKSKADLQAKSTDDSKQPAAPAAITPVENGLLESTAKSDTKGFADIRRNDTEKLAGRTVTARRLPVDADGDGVQDNFDKLLTQAEKKKEAKAFEKVNVFRGRVTDSSNNALPFTNITNLEDTVGTYTDVRGYFILTSPDSVLNVQVRSLGYATSKIQLSNTSSENKIALGEDRSLNARVLDTTRRNINRSRHSSMTLEDAEPVDGWGNYDTYLVNNLQVPESFAKKQGGGEVVLAFEVDKNGIPVNITVKRSLCESCDREAIRLLKEGPKWKRKNRKGKTTVTVSF